MKILVTATNYSQYCRNGKLSLEKGGYEIIENPYNRPMTEAELIPLVRDVDGVITGAENWRRTLLETAGKLKVIARFGVTLIRLRNTRWPCCCVCYGRYPS